MEFSKIVAQLPVKGWVFSALMALGLLVFGPGLKAPYYFDDVELVELNRFVGQGPGLSWYVYPFYDGARQHAGYRPTLMKSFDLNAKIFEKTSFSLRLGNLFLHVCVTFLVWLLLFRFSPLVGGTGPPQILWLMAAILFMVHPNQTVAMTMLWKRSEVLCVMWMFCAMLCFFQSEKTNQTRWLFLEGLFWFLAVTTKELGVIYILWRMGVVALNQKHWNKRQALSFIVLAFLTAGFYHFRTSTVREVENKTLHQGPSDFRSVDRATYLQTSVQTWAQYAQAFFLPKPLLMDDPKHLNHFPWGALCFLVGLFLSVGIFIVYFPQHRSVLSGFGLFAVVSLLPTSVNTFFVKDPIRNYSLTLFFSIWVCLCVYEVLKHSRSLNVVWVLSVLCIPYGLSSFVQSDRTTHPQLIWEDVHAAYPHSEIAMDHLGNIYRQKKEYERALEVYNKGFEENPNKPGFFIKQQLTKAFLGKPKAEVVAALKTLDAEKLNINDYLELGLSLATLGENETAEKIFTRAIANYPNLTRAHLSLALIFESTNRKDLAFKAYKNVLTLDPENERARKGLRRLEN